MFNARLAGHSEIDNHQLRSLAPSVFAGQAHAKVSDRYRFIPTATVVDGLRAEGWAPVWAGEQRIRLSDRQGFQKHMIRLARQDDLQRTQAERPELVLVNSHDRSSAYQLHAGIFRFVCSNGMILADSVFARISIMHVNFEPSKVIEASFNIVREMPAIADLLEGYKARTLNTVERRDLWRGSTDPQVRRAGEGTGWSPEKDSGAPPPAKTRHPRSGTCSTWCRKT